MKMIYDPKLVLILAGVFAVAGCELKTKTAEIPQYDANAEAAYFNDAMDSVGEDEAADSSVDDSTREHIAGPKLDAMADHKIAELDTDKSGTVSEKEFLDHHARRHESDKSVTEDKKVKRQERLKAEFAKVSGDDKVMSRDELKAFIENQGPRVSGHRRRGREAEANRKAHPEIETHGGSQSGGGSSGSDDGSGRRSGTETESHSGSGNRGRD